MVATAYSQTISERRKDVALENKISEYRDKISSLNKQLEKLIDYSGEVKSLQRELDTLNATSPSTDFGRELKARAIKEKQKELKTILKKQADYTSASWKRVERDSLLARVARFDNKDNQMFEKQVTSNATPDELTRLELKRRIFGHYNKREDLVFEKLKSNPMYGDHTSLMGVMANDYYVPLVFKITPLDGGESKAPLVASGQVLQEKLVPGTYMVSFFDGGHEIGCPIKITVNAVVTSFKGIDCHWYAYMPRFLN